MFSEQYQLRASQLAAAAFCASGSTVALPHEIAGSTEKAIGLLRSESFGAAGALDNAIICASRSLKRELYLDTVRAVVPVYVSSICAENCAYCNYRTANSLEHISRVRLSDDQLRAEIEYLISVRGYRALELVYAADPLIPSDVICRHVAVTKHLLDQWGGGIVGLNAESFDEPDYRALRDAGVGFVVLWQETYDKARYCALHAGKTKKCCFEYRLDAYDRMLSAGLRAIGMGVLSGLAEWRADWAMLMLHEDYLSRQYGIRPAILGVPRLKPAVGAAVQTTPYIPDAHQLRALVALHNLYSPHTMAFVNTRESWDVCLDLAAGGGCLFTFDCATIPGGYSLGQAGYQFPTASFDPAVYLPRLRNSGLRPIFKWSFGADAHAEVPIRSEDNGR